MTRDGWHSAARAALLLSVASSTSAYGATCSDILPSVDGAPQGQRPLSAADLVKLRDIGPGSELSDDTEIFSLSPDETSIAFQLRRPDITANDYCLAMVVVSLGRSGPVLVDEGGEFIRRNYDFHGKAAFPTGVARTITPQWSSDGQWIAFLKRLNGVNQVWRADAGGRGSAPVTRSDIDIEDFRLTSGGRSIVYATRPALREAVARIEMEGLSGFHYDDRYAPVSSSRPFPEAPVPLAYVTLDIASGKLRESSTDEVALLTYADPGHKDAQALARSKDGRAAWIADADDGSFPSISRVMVETEKGDAIACRADMCSGQITSVVWTGPGDALRFFRREGWASSSTAIYEWTPTLPAPKRLFATDDILSNCRTVGSDLLCVREGSTSSRQIVRLDPASGKSTTIFNPNPELSTLQMGRVERLKWKNEFGLESFGDLVLPTDYRPGTRYPLIVVQYQTRGFLRGGTGDEYPIQVFANRGYAVLSLNRPRDMGLILGGRTYAEAERLNLVDFADRKSVQSTLERGVQVLIDRGLVDPQRIGITGLSDGASTIQFALLHSKMFAAAAMGSCCWDPNLPLRVGPGAMRVFSAVGYPGLLDPATAFWAQISFARNATKVSVPILMQLADTEYMSALEGYTALREAGAPVAMYVFPGEQHIKWQPAHRLAVYLRNLAWFDFWLRGISPLPDVSGIDTGHWDALRKPASPAVASK